MRTLFFFAIIALPALTFGQYQETLTSDRPGQTMSAYTVGSKTFQIQNGFNFFGSNSSSLTQNGVQDFLNLRLGIIEKFEVSLNATFGNTNTVVGSIKSSTGMRFTTLMPAARVKILEGEGFKPNLAFQGGLTLDPTNSMNPGFLFLLATNNSWDWFSVSTNLGATSQSGASAVNWPYTLSLGFGLTQSISAFAEIYGTFDNITRPAFDAGISVVPIDDLQLDLFGGYSKVGAQNNWFGEIGLSYRLSWRGN